MKLRLRENLRDMSSSQAPGTTRLSSGTEDASDRSQRGSASSRIRIPFTLFIIGFLTLLVLLTRIDKPRGLFFDEFGYVGVARNLLHGTLGPMPREFTESTVGRQHPPMGPYLIAEGIKLAGDNPVGWRLPGAICGTLTVVAIFLWTYVLIGDYWLAVTAACLTVFNDFLYVMSRTAMLDVFVFTFVIWAALTFTVAIAIDDLRTRMRRILIIFSGLLFGLGMACKWNAVDTLAAATAVTVLLLMQMRYWPRLRSNLQPAARNLKAIGLPYLFAGFVVAPVISYTVAFLPLMHAMHQPLTFSSIVKIHVTMMALTKAAPGNLTQYAPWYTWPLRITPSRALSYLLGNPVVMWGGLVSLVFCARKLWRCLSLPEMLVVGFYLTNLLQWAVTPLKVPNYYYYFSAAMFLGPTLAIALKDSKPLRVFGVRLSFVVLLSAFLVFLYCYPRMAYLEAPWDCMFGCWN